MSPFIVWPANVGLAPVCILCGNERTGLPLTPLPFDTFTWLVVPVIVLAEVVFNAVRASIPFEPGSAIPSASSFQ